MFAYYSLFHSTFLFVESQVGKLDRHLVVTTIRVFLVTWQRSPTTFHSLNNYSTCISMQIDRVIDGVSRHDRWYSLPWNSFEISNASSYVPVKRYAQRVQQQLLDFSVASVDTWPKSDTRAQWRPCTHPPTAATTEDSGSRLMTQECSQTCAWWWWWCLSALQSGWWWGRWSSGQRHRIYRRGKCPKPPRVAPYKMLWLYIHLHQVPKTWRQPCKLCPISSSPSSGAMHLPLGTWNVATTKSQVYIVSKPRQKHDHWRILDPMWTRNI